MSRAEHIAHFAEGVKEGRHERTTRYLYTDPVTGDKDDISTEVLEAAGPESDAETEARELQRERDWPWHLASRLEEDLYHELEMCSTYVRGYGVEPIEASPDHPDELVFEREDGKRYVVEIHVDVRPAD